MFRFRFYFAQARGRQKRSPRAHPPVFSISTGKKFPRRQLLEITTRPHVKDGVVVQSQTFFNRSK